MNCADCKSRIRATAPSASGWDCCPKCGSVCFKHGTPQGGRKFCRIHRNPKPKKDEEQRTTTSGRPPEQENAGAPAPIDPATGQHKDYWILSKEERAKGFVRPVRTSYRHVGTAPKHPLRDLTDEEKELYAGEGFAKYEEYPQSERPKMGKFWAQGDLDNRGCGAVTKMSLAIAETYARKPSFYGATFCVGCGEHLSVGEDGEFVWIDGGSTGGSPAARSRRRRPRAGQGWQR